MFFYSCYLFLCYLKIQMAKGSQKPSGCIYATRSFHAVNQTCGLSLMVLKHSLLTESHHTLKHHLHVGRLADLTDTLQVFASTLWCASATRHTLSCLPLMNKLPPQHPLCKSSALQVLLTCCLAHCLKPAACYICGSSSSIFPHTA